MKARVLFAFGMITLALSVLAGTVKTNAVAAAAPTPVPRTMPNFAPMKMFMGTWHCTQQLRGKVRTDTSTTTMALDGQYMMTHDVSPPFDKYRSVNDVIDSYVTYNPVTKLWTTIGVDNYGGYFVNTSPGWSGNTMRTTIKMSNDGSSGYDVLTKLSDTSTTDHSVTKGPNGKVTTATINCRKTA